MYDSASGVVTSLSATTRSTSRPINAELVLAEALDAAPSGSGRRMTTPSALGLLAAGLVDERRHASDELAHALRR